MNWLAEILILMNNSVLLVEYRADLREAVAH